VALKFLPDAVAREAQALARFQREAQAASALNHPNICAIHDIGEENGRAFIAMEYLDGATLKHLINGQAMELEKLLDLSIEVTEFEVIRVRVSAFVNLQAEYFAATADALRLRSDSLGFEAEVNGDRNVRGNGPTTPRCWFIPVLLQGFHRGLAQ
jgi:hypothetical protein